VYTKEILEEKKLEFYDKNDYLKFLIKESIKKRKNEIENEKKHKILTFNDKSNCLILPEPSFSALKKIENDNFFIIIPGDYTKNKELLIKTLELYLINKLAFINGLFEFYGLFYEEMPFFHLKELVDISPYFYYNILYNFGLTYSGFSLSLKKEDFVKLNLSPELIEKNESLKESIKEFMDFFKLKILIRKGRKPFYYEIDKKHKLVSIANNIALIDTELKIFSRESLFRE
jgi:hypothetical protein